jgi:two-component system cell cycle response regulator DivK
LVLIIEDNPKNLKLIRDLLRVHAYRTVEAEDGPAGVELARIHRPDAIVMDIQLPTLGGYEVTRLLKADARTRHIPVLGVTSFAMSGEETRAREAGCDAYLSKPIDIHRFIRTLQEVLRRKELR